MISRYESFVTFLTDRTVGQETCMIVYKGSLQHHLFSSNPGHQVIGKKVTLFAVILVYRDANQREKKQSGLIDHFLFPF